MGGDGSLFLMGGTEAFFVHIWSWGWAGPSDFLLWVQNPGIRGRPPAKSDRQQNPAVSKIKPPAKSGRQQNQAVSKIKPPAKSGRQQNPAVSKIRPSAKSGRQQNPPASKIRPSAKSGRQQNPAAGKIQPSAKSSSWQNLGWGFGARRQQKSGIRDGRGVSFNVRLTFSANPSLNFHGVQQPRCSILNT